MGVFNISKLMAKPVIVFNFSIMPDDYEKNHIHHKIKALELDKDYHTIIIFGCKETKVELLCKGRHHKTLKKLNLL